jgi:peptide/nickel transport system substrate-binding protein
MAQSLADGVPYPTLAPLMVGPAWDPSSAQWAGPPSELLVRDDAPWLIEVARAVAVSASTPSHEVVVNPRPVGEIARRRVTRAFALMLDVACPAGPGDMGTLLGLATADDAASAVALARHPPRGSLTARTLTRTMRIGVVAEIRLQGGLAPDIVLPPSPWGRGVDWGNAFRMRAGARP